MVNIILRIIILLAFFVQWIYWGKAEKKADKEKPKTEISTTLYKFSSKVVFKIIYWIVLLQVVGVQIFPIPNPLLFQATGVLLVVSSIAMTIFARKELASNWASGYEYQIRKHHELITAGVYRYIRHPIYLAMSISFIGAEMVAGSWLFIAMFGIFVGAYIQGRREEKILLAHFGKRYQEYMKRTKMLIPFVL